MPCSERRARLLLERGRAVAVRRYPFTIRLWDRVGGATQGVRIKLDPGSKTTGIALVANPGGNKPAKVLALFELQHRGMQISKRLTARRALRRRRRGAHLRYRAPRFANRTRPQGSLAPSLRHRVDTILSWVRRLRGLGDIVRADIVQGKKTGTYIGRVAVRASGWFNVQTLTGVVQGINVRHCTLVHRSDGYSYRGPRLLPTDKSGGIRRGKIR
jgi:hypothetical protein